MFVDTTAQVAFRQATSPAADRTYDVEPTEPYWHGRGYFARLRRYGRGGGCVARGEPCYYESIQAANAAGGAWVEQGR